MRYLKILLILFFAGIIAPACRHSSFEFSTVVRDFEDHTKGISKFYFYPGTIKMLNIKKDTAYANLFRDVKKMKFLSFSGNEKDSLDPQKIRKIITELHNEGFQDMMQMKQDKQQLFLFSLKGKDIPHLVGINISAKDVYVIEILGNLKLSYLSGFLNGGNNFEGFNTVLKLNKSASLQSSQK
jgi:hypothetical protein